MTEILARDIMTTEIVTLGPEQTVTEAAKILSEHHISGAPVLDNGGNLLGIVSENDLIIQDVKLHFPHYIQFLDSYIYLGSLAKFESTLKKAVAAKVKEIMTPDVTTTVPEASIEDVATLMVRQNVHLLPIMKDSHLVGVVSKGDIVRSLGRD
ncbi:MAG: CBS domain-containing protein [Actinomycetota bacterium]|nr:CBS domain-containing protein [Actinomycetota bacterium]